MTTYPTTTRAEAALDADFDSLRRALQAEVPTRGVEVRILAAFRKQSRQSLWRERVARWLTPALAYASGIAVIGWIAFAPVVPPAPGYLASTAAAENQPFIALQSFERIEAESSMQIVDTTLPRFALNGYGIDVAPENAGDSVRAQWLVSHSGDLLAVRISAL